MKNEVTKHEPTAENSGGKPSTFQAGFEQRMAEFVLRVNRLLWPRGKQLEKVPGSYRIQNRFPGIEERIPPVALDALAREARAVLCNELGFNVAGVGGRDARG